jgi:RNA polymerase sigma-70 factor (ECF subfamily)
MPATAILASSTMADRDALFAELVRNERERAVALAYHLTGGDRDAAQDVAQEAFVRAYRALAGFRGEAQLSTWFLRIVAHQAATYRRWRAVRQRFAALVPADAAPEPEPEPPDPRPSPEGSAADSATRRRIAKAMGRLPATQRLAFALVHLEQFTVEEAAGVMNKAPGTVKSHLHRALVALRRELADLQEERHA